MIHGGVEAGPNAVLAFKREGYSWEDFSPKDILENGDLSWLLENGLEALGDGAWERCIARSVVKRS